MIERIGRLLLYILLFPGVLLFRVFNHDIWLFYSRPDECDGNSYALYEWASSRHKCYFLLDKESPKFKKGMIPYKSIRHIFLSFASDIFIFDVLRDEMVYGENIRNRLGMRTIKVFLQHGIMMGPIPLYFYEKTRNDLVISSSVREFQFLKDVFHYPETNLALTGLARYDDLLVNCNDKNYILIMPTWNTELRFDSDEEFVNSEFYKGFQSLLNNQNLIRFMNDNNLKLRFYLHYKIHDKHHLFNIPSEVSIYDSTDSVHELLRDCSILITDYSSVAFDVALAGKALVYYQFQQYRYQSDKQYFKFDDDGFGPVVSAEDSLVQTIVDLWNGISFEQLPLYKKRRDDFFSYQDTNNCQRIYDRIIECQKLQ